MRLLLLCYCLALLHTTTPLPICLLGEEEVEDPMAIDPDALAKKAGASTPTKSPPKHKERPLGVKGLEDLDVEILATPVGDKDLAVDQLRRHANELLTNNVKILPAHRTDAEGPLTAFAAAAYREMLLDDFNMRGSKVNSKVKKQVQKVAAGTNAATESPAKILKATQLLFGPQLAPQAAADSMTGIMESAMHALGTADPSKSSLEVLNDLLQSHKQAKRSRATRQCFTQHVSSARNHLLQGIAASRARGNDKLAYDLLECLRYLEQHFRKFLTVCDSVGFDQARDLYLTRGNPLGGMSDETWTVVTDLAGDGNYKAIFAKLVKDKAITLPEVDRKHSADSSSDELAETPKKKRKGAMGSQAPRQGPYCNYCCSSGHSQADCYQWKQAMRLMSNGGAGGASGGGRHKGFKPKQHGNHKSNSK